MTSTKKPKDITSEQELKFRSRNIAIPIVVPVDLHKPTQRRPVRKTKLENIAHVCNAQRVANPQDSFRAIFLSMRKIITPDSTSENVIGHDKVVTQVERAFLLFNHMAGVVQSKNIVRSILLCGPPGVGKTNLMMNLSAKVAKILGQPISFFRISAAQMLGKYVGESEKCITAMWDVVEECAPSLVVFDEVEGIMGKRDSQDSAHSKRFKDHLLSEMEGYRKSYNVVVVATTNLGDQLDDAFVRRFKARFYMHPPKPEERLQIFYKFMEMNSLDVRHIMGKREESQFMDETGGFTGDDICSVVTFIIDGLVNVEKNTNPKQTSHALVTLSSLKKDDIFSAIGRVRSVSNSTELRAAAKWGTRMCEPSSSNNEDGSTENEEKKHSYCCWGCFHACNAH